MSAPTPTDAVALDALRVALVTPRYAPSIGGVEAHVGAIADALATTGSGVTVLTQTRRPVARRDGDIAVRGFRELIPSDAYPVAPGIFRWLRENADDLDVVHAHSYHGAPALAAAFAAEGAFVFTPHYHGDGHTAFARVVHRGYRNLGRRVFERADRIICVSKAEAELVSSHHPYVSSRIDVVPNGVDVDGIAAAAPYGRSRPVVLVLGRLLRYKRVDAVIRAMAALGDEAELVVVGDGPDRPDLAGLAAALGVSARFLGRVEAGEVNRWLCTAAVVVSASAHEAFGLTLLEGLTAGARVVASAIPAHREVAATWGGDDRVLLVEDPGNAQALADALRSQLGAGRVDGSSRPRWSWLDVATRTAAVYRRALGEIRC